MGTMPRRYAGISMASRTLCKLPRTTGNFYGHSPMTGAEKARSVVRKVARQMELCKRALRLSLPVLALVALVPMAHAVARLEVLPRDRVPNGDFSRPAGRPAQALIVNPGESG